MEEQIFFDEQKEAFIAAVSDAVVKYPVTVEKIESVLPLIGELSARGIDIHWALTSLLDRVHNHQTTHHFIPRNPPPHCANAERRAIPRTK